MPFDDVPTLVLDYVRANWLALSAAAISILSAYFAWSQRRQELRISWIRDLVAWAKGPMTTLARAEIEVARLQTLTPDEASRIRIDLRSQLSAELDQGRLFFENNGRYRPDLLDPIMRAFRLLGADPEKYTPQHLQRCMSRHRTDFWRHVQEKVDTQWLRKAVGAPGASAGDGSDDFDAPSGALKK